MKAILVAKRFAGSGFELDEPDAALGTDLLA